MSQENVELVRRIYQTVGDAEAVLALYDPDVVWDFSHSPVGDTMGQAIYQGHQGLRDWWRDWGDAWETYEDSCEELIDAGEKVISRVASRGRGRASGADVEWSQYGVWSVRDSRVVRVEWLAAREDALQAAGLLD